MAIHYWEEKLKKSSIVDSTPLEQIESDIVCLKVEKLSYLNKVSNGNSLAIYTILLSIYNSLLQRYFNLNGLVFSNKVDGTTVLLFRIIPIGNYTLKDYMQELKHEVQETLQCSNYGKDFSEKYPFHKYTTVAFSFCNNSISSHQFPFTLHVNKVNENFEFKVRFSSSFVANDVVKHFLNTYIKLIEHLEEYIDVKISAIPIITIEEKRLILDVFNDTHLAYPQHETMADLFEYQVSQTPNHIAVLWEDSITTYQELNDSANQMGNCLLQDFNIRAGNFVGIKINRNEKLLVAILAVLKIGATYVPIDQAYPKERIKYIQSNSDCKLIIDEIWLDNFYQIKKTFSTSLPIVQRTSNSLAYIIYTSGTTGSPKGVMISNQNIVALLNWAKQEFDDTKFDMVYATTSYCFDLSAFELFYPLSVGKKIRILNSALDIGSSLKHEKRVLINTVPSSIRSLLESGYSLENASIINLAGEPFPPEIAKKLLLTNAEVRNLYGPSEDTTYSTVYQLSKDNEYLFSVPIGRPISNTKVYILDDNLKLVPIGVSGKLYVSGDGVAKGYLNQKALTDSKFVSNPFEIGHIMYDTGDIAKWAPNGNIIFKGRKDDQIKVRGYRIELGEIESCIHAYSRDISEAVTLLKKSEKTEYLVSFYVSKNSIDKSLLKSYLQERLPNYMMPDHLVALKEIPLTPNGKIDKRTLSNINVIKKKDVIAFNDIEERIAFIWQKVLGIEGGGLTDSFFDLGGHSLKIGEVINELHLEFGKTITYKQFYNTPTIQGLAKSLSEHERYLPIPKIEKSNSYPLSSAQKRLWMISQIDGGGQAYNMSAAVRMSGIVDVNCLELALKDVIDRHEILRTYFKQEGLEIRQFIKEGVDFKLEILGLNNSYPIQKKVDSYLHKLAHTPFNLENSPLLRATLIQTGKKEYIFFLSIHHIVSDEWSIGVLISEITKFYANHTGEKKVVFPPLSIQYKDFSVWSLKQKKQKSFIQLEKYWLNRFAGDIPVLNLPICKGRPLITTFTGNTITHKYSSGFLNSLKAFSKANGVTLFATLFASVNALLYRYTFQEEIIIGTPVAGRNHPALKQQIGLYVNTLPIKTNLKRNLSFKDLVIRQQRILIEALDYQEYPFDQLVEKLNVQRTSSHSPLFDVMVVMNQEQLENINESSPLSGISITPYEIKDKTAQFDLTFSFVEQEGLKLSLNYNSDILDDFFIRQIFTHIETFLKQAILDNSSPISEINYLTKQEEQILLSNFNNTDNLYPKDKTIVDIFVSQVGKTPDNIALIFEGKSLTYRDLNGISNQLANYLITNYGIEKDDILGVQLDRGFPQIISILSILKSGGAYVPISPQLPTKRVEFIVEDGNCKVVINEEEWNSFIMAKHQYSSNVSINKAKVDCLAYVMYTSGTVGNPKGVMIEHQNVSNLIYWFTNQFEIGASTRSIQLTDFSFDPSIEDIFGTFSKGGTFHIISRDLLLNIPRLQSYIKDNEITILNYVPNILDKLLSGYPTIESIKTVISGGEKLTNKIKDSISSKGYVLYNNYGPTEITVDALCGKMEKTGVNLGKPISNVQAYIVDAFQNLTPIGVNGELLIGGNGVARGYLNREKLTKEKFIDNPFGVKGCLYKTGDVAKWQPNGTIKFLGRQDTQVKLNGYRIELEEIEMAISQFNVHIKSIIVVLHKVNNTPTLIAYYSSAEKIDNKQLRKYLKLQLPTYSVPRYLMQLENIPLTINGKIDIKHLPEVSQNQLIRNEYVEPRNDIELKLSIIWKKILQIKKVGVKDDFFDLGGQSLMVVRLVGDIQETFGVLVPFKKVFSNMILEEQAALIKNTMSIELINKDLESNTGSEHYII